MESLPNATLCALAEHGMHIHVLLPGRKRVWEARALVCWTNRTIVAVQQLVIAFCYCSVQPAAVHFTRCLRAGQCVYCTAGGPGGAALQAPFGEKRARLHACLTSERISGKK